LQPRFIQRSSVLGRVGNADEIAHTALFLASDEAPFATGAPFIHRRRLDCKLDEARELKVALCPDSTAKSQS